MHALAWTARAISAVNARIGALLSWLALGIVLVCFVVVVMRYAFAYGQVWMQDLYVWLNGIMFTGVAAFTLLRNGHVRVDIFYRPSSVRRKAWIDLFGCFAFLFPFTLTVAYWSWSYVARSWRFMESSGNIGGMPGLYILKSFIIVFAVLVTLQGVAMVLRSILVLADRSDLLPPDLQYREGG